ncbi:MAG: hypothetical protein WB586_05715 [Chthoniobacterales bacterium]
MNEPQEPTLAESERSETWTEELSHRNEDKLYLALSSARMGSWDWHPLDHSMH